MKMKKKPFAELFRSLDNFVCGELYFTLYNSAIIYITYKVRLELELEFEVRK